MNERDRIQRQLRENIRDQKALFDVRRNEWAKQLTGEVAQLQQENERLVAECSEKSAIAQTQAEECAALSNQLTWQKADNQHLREDYEARILAEQDRYRKIEEGMKRARAEVKQYENEALEPILAIENKTAELNKAIKVLKEENTQLQKTQQQDKEQFEQALLSAEEPVDISFEDIISQLFPNLLLLRDSFAECNRHKKDIAAILCRLQALHNKSFEYSKKVHVTSDEWFEVKAPHMHMIRIYFRKRKSAPSGKCEVLISEKKDKKTQRKDLAWIKQQPKKR